MPRLAAKVKGSAGRFTAPALQYNAVSKSLVGRIAYNHVKLHTKQPTQVSGSGILLNKSLVGWKDVILSLTIFFTSLLKR